MILSGFQPSVSIDVNFKRKEYLVVCQIRANFKKRGSLQFKFMVYEKNYFYLNVGGSKKRRTTLMLLTIFKVCSVD